MALLWITQNNNYIEVIHAISYEPRTLHIAREPGKDIPRDKEIALQFYALHLTIY